MEFSLVLPCFNEEQNIERTIRDAVSWFRKEGIDGEIVAVNDGSADETGAIIDRLAKEFSFVRPLHHKRNGGDGAALRSGCNAGTKKYIGFMDSDGQFRAGQFTELLLRLPEYRIVAGVRMERADPWNRKLNAWLYGCLVRLVLGVKKRDINCALVVFEKLLWPSICPRFATGALFCGEMYYRLKKTGTPLCQVGVQHFPRTAGRSTGANPFVILRMFRELRKLKKDVRGSEQKS